MPDDAPVPKKRKLASLSSEFIRVTHM